MVNGQIGLSKCYFIKNIPILHNDALGTWYMPLGQVRTCNMVCMDCMAWTAWHGLHGMDCMDSHVWFVEGKQTFFIFGCLLDMHKAVCTCNAMACLDCMDCMDWMESLYFSFYFLFFLVSRGKTDLFHFWSVSDQAQGGLHVRS